MFDWLKQKLRPEPKQDVEGTLMVLDMEADKLNGAAAELAKTVKVIKSQRSAMSTLMDQTLEGVNGGKQ